MNILITGANGQLGNEMRVLSAQHTHHTYFFTDIDELDITSREAVKQFVSGNAIDIIVNCAAYTNVDKAEIDENLAHKINASAVENLGLSGARVIHISTDYVFSGEACVPYAETDSVAPRTAYGRTKREGEKLLQAVSDEAIIIRTAWLYSTFGNNFVKTMLRLGSERKELGVVFDQTGTPCYARDLAKVVLLCLDKDFEGQILHFSNEGVCSWYDFALKIMQLGKKDCHVRPIRTADYPTHATRPAYSVLDKADIKQFLGIEIPHWEESLNECLKRL